MHSFTPRRPVAGDDSEAKAIALDLVEETGFDGIGSGSLSYSWRRQPGTPDYCTELKVDELRSALNAADKGRAPKYRDALINDVISSTNPMDQDQTVERNRAVTMTALL